GEASVLNPEIGLEQIEQRATFGAGSRQRVWVLQADGKLKSIDVVTGESDGRLTAVTSKQLRAGMKVVTGKAAVAQ
ncbi:MAG: efflux RND transporter periplasmic adaptor subunit, partial [Sphingopyxis sp.]